MTSPLRSPSLIIPGQHSSSPAPLELRLLGEILSSSGFPHGNASLTLQLPKGRVTAGDPAMPSPLSHSRSTFRHYRCTQNSRRLDAFSFKDRGGGGEGAEELPYGKSHQPEQDFNNYTFLDLFHSHIFNVSWSDLIKRKKLIK